MGKTLIWIIAIVVLNAVVAALGKKAQANAQAAKQGTAAPPPPPGPSRGLARPQGKQSAAGRAMRPPKPPQPRGYVVDAIGDSSDALQSRKHLAEQVAKLKAAEARVAQASGIKADHSSLTRLEVGRAPALGAAELRKSLRNPADIRKALILGEILGRPRGA